MKNNKNMKNFNEKYIHITKDGKYRVQIRPNKKITGKFDETFDNPQQAVDERDKFLAKQKLGIDIYVDKNITFSAFCDKYFEWLKNKPKKTSSNTFRDYAGRIRNLKKYFKDKPLYKITTADIEIFLAEESKRNKIDPNHPETETNTQITSNTLHHEYVMLRILFNKAVSWKILSDNPMDGVEEPTIKIENEIEHIPYEEFESTIDIIDKYADVRDRLIFKLGLGAGLRAEEVCGLHCIDENDKESDIDFEKNKCHLYRAVKQNFDTREYIEEELKSQYSERGIPLPSFVMESLKEYLPYRKQYVKMLKYKFGDKYKDLPNLFLNKDGDLFRPAYVGKLWKKFRKEHGIKATFHGLRHTYITYQMNYNEDLTPSEVQALAGHANISTTYKYVHKSDEKMKKATTVFDNVFNNKIDINEDNTIFAPIMFVASVITGVEYVEIGKIKEFLNIMNPSYEITYNNLSESIKDTKDYLLANYPSLENMRLLSKRYNKEDFENKIKAVYGNKFLLETINSEKEYIKC